MGWFCSHPMNMQHEVGSWLLPEPAGPPGTPCAAWDEARGRLCHRVPSPAICASVELMVLTGGGTQSWLCQPEPPMQGLSGALPGVPVEMVSEGTCGTMEAPAGFTWDGFTQPWQIKLPSTCASPGHLHPAGSQPGGSLELPRHQQGPG